MNNRHHTTWYLANEPDNGPPPPPLPERSLSNGFRFVTFGPGAPYPEHDMQQQPQPFMIDMLSGEQWQRGGELRQPVAEDFLVPSRIDGRVQGYDAEDEEYGDYEDKPLPDLPVEAMKRDPWADSIEPEPYIAVPQTSQAGPSDIVRHNTIASSKPHNTLSLDPAPKRSKSAVGVAGAPVQVSPMANDFFSPVLGGLQRLPIVPQKESKSQRFKRMFSFGSRRRKYGRASR